MCNNDIVLSVRTIYYSIIIIYVYDSYVVVWRFSLCRPFPVAELRVCCSVVLCVHNIHSIDNRTNARCEIGYNNKYKW